MRIAICDDIAADRKILRDKISKYFDGSTIIDEAETVDEMGTLLNNNRYDLVFQDLVFDNKKDKGIVTHDIISNEMLDTYVIYYTSLRSYTKRTYGEKVLWVISVCF